ncbi:MAG: hypothetical protein ABMA64_10930 [Myxococcota bacterium]
MNRATALVMAVVVAGLACSGAPVAPAPAAPAAAPERVQLPAEPKPGRDREHAREEPPEVDLPSAAAPELGKLTAEPAGAGCGCSHPGASDLVYWRGGAEPTALMHIDGKDRKLRIAADRELGEGMALDLNGSGYVLTLEMLPNLMGEGGIRYSGKATFINDGMVRTVELECGCGD